MLHFDFSEDTTARELGEALVKWSDDHPGEAYPRAVSRKTVGGQLRMRITFCVPVTPISSEIFKPCGFEPAR